MISLLVVVTQCLTLQRWFILYSLVKLHTLGALASVKVVMEPDQHLRHQTFGKSFPTHHGSRWQCPWISWMATHTCTSEVHWGDRHSSADRRRAHTYIYLHLAPSHHFSQVPFKLRQFSTTYLAQMGLGVPPSSFNPVGTHFNNVTCCNIPVEGFESVLVKRL